MPCSLRFADVAIDAARLRPIVLVHGGMHGAWCWRPVQSLLFADGHLALTPTLTGLGQRAHLGTAATSLDDHITDILQCIDSEELTDVVLVGHSYGGMVITGVADRVPDRIGDLVYLDALVPEDGQSAADLVSRGVDFSNLPDGMLPRLADYDFGLTDPGQIAWVRRRITPQSARTVTEPIALRGASVDVRRTFIECTEHRGTSAQMAAIAARAAELAADPAWRHVRLAAGHDCMISHPRETADLLLAIAKGERAIDGEDRR